MIWLFVVGALMGIAEAQFTIWREDRARRKK